MSILDKIKLCKGPALLRTPGSPQGKVLTLLDIVMAFVDKQSFPFV